MDCLNEDRNNELENTILNIVRDAHNKAILDCYHLVLEISGGSETDEIKTTTYSDLEKQMVELLKP